jgi:DNA-binding MarR family transcriptional regulator
MPRSNQIIPVEDYVLDVLLRDLVGHDKHPAAFLVYVNLYGMAARGRWRPVAASLRDIAEATGLSKSAVQTALRVLRRRELVSTKQTHRTATPRHRVLRHWAARRGT